MGLSGGVGGTFRGIGDLFVGLLRGRKYIIDRAVGYIFKRHKFFCEPLQWFYGPCTKCLVTFDLISKAYLLFSISVVKVHATQAYRNMERTMERIGVTFDLRNMLLSKLAFAL